MGSNEATKALGTTSGGIRAVGVSELRATRKVGFDLGVKRGVQPGAKLPGNEK